MQHERFGDEDRMALASEVRDLGFSCVVVKWAFGHPMYGVGYATIHLKISF